MKLVVVLFVGLLLGSSAFAETTYQVYLVNAQNRFEKGEDLNMVARSPRNFAVGAMRDGGGVLAEYASYQVDSGAGDAKIQRSHQEFLVWLKKDLGGWRLLRWEAAAAAGVLREEAVTRLEDLKATDTGRPELLTGLSLGGALSIPLSTVAGMKTALQVSLEGRALFASSFDPNPQPDIILRTGFQF